MCRTEDMLVSFFLKFLLILKKGEYCSPTLMSLLGILAITTFVNDFAKCNIHSKLKTKRDYYRSLNFILTITFPRIIKKHTHKSVRFFSTNAKQQLILGITRLILIFSEENWKPLADKSWTERWSSASKFVISSVCQPGLDLK